MKKIISNLYAKLQLLKHENGQDLVEYALLVALIAFGVVAGIKNIATGVNTTFTTLATVLSTTIS